MRLLSGVFLIGLCIFCNAQQIDCFSTNFNDSLQHGINFKFNQHTQKFSYHLVLASKKYPELNGTTIEVKRKKITTMMAARPKRNFLVHKKESRSYVILITDKYNMNAEKLYDSMSTCATIGVLGHELSHILTYTQKSNYQMLLFGIKYVFNRKQIETETDILAIKRGFGNGLVEYTNYIHHSPWVNKTYLRRKSKYYMSANELSATLYDSF